MRAISVEWCFLKPNCIGDNSSSFSTKAVNLLANAFSMSVAVNGRTEIGILVIKWLSPCLNMGVTLAIFSSAGTMPAEKEELMIAEINSATGSRVDLATSGSISAGPEDRLHLASHARSIISCGWRDKGQMNSAEMGLNSLPVLFR